MPETSTALSDVARAPAITPDSDRLLRHIHHRQWWLWSSALSVLGLLAIGVASFALPAMLSGSQSLADFLLNGAIRGLLGLVLVFNVYVVYEQRQLDRLRREVTQNLYSLAVMDPLTELCNRRHIERRLEEEITRCRRSTLPLKLILFDLDGFKQVNDEFGHVVGDGLLRAFADRLRRATRGSDLAARYGGDEFLVLLPECNPEAVEQILRRIDGLSIPVGEKLFAVRYSAGWADYIAPETAKDFLHRADMALYADKRNRKRA